MSDAPLPDIDDERFDYVHVRRPGIFRRRSTPEKPGNGLAVAVAVGSLLLQLGSIAWTGGRLEERVSRHDKDLAEQAGEIKEIRGDVTKQATVISAANATYAEILRRLDAIDGRFDKFEAKLDGNSR